MKKIMVALLGIGVLCGFLYAQAGSQDMGTSTSGEPGVSTMPGSGTGMPGPMARDRMMEMNDPEMQGMHEYMMFHKALDMDQKDPATLDLYAKVLKDKKTIMAAEMGRLDKMEELVEAMKKGDQDSIQKARENLKAANEEVMKAWAAGKQDRMDLRNKIGPMGRGMMKGEWNRMGTGRMRMGTSGYSGHAPEGAGTTGGSWTGTDK